MTLTKDGLPYVPGMTLYGDCAGLVVERLTYGLHDNPDYALVAGVGVPIVNIPSHYGTREAVDKAARWSREHSRLVREGQAKNCRA